MAGLRGLVRSSKESTGVGQVGGRQRMRRKDRRFGMKMGVMEGGLRPLIKTLKERSVQRLYLMELMLLSMGSSMGTRRLFLCRSPLASIRSVHTPAQGDLRQTLNSPQ